MKRSAELTAKNSVGRLQGKPQLEVTMIGSMGGNSEEVNER